MPRTVSWPALAAPRPANPLPGRGCPMTPDHVPTPAHASWLSRPVRERALVILLLLFVAGPVLLDRSFNYTVLLYGLALVCLGVALHRLRGSARTLEEARAHTQAILDMAADGILTADERGAICSFNR